MLIFGTTSFATGIVFLLLGAWPVLGFFGLDVALVWLAFRLNFRSGRISETVEIWPGKLTLTRRDRAGRTEQVHFNPYWVRVRTTEGHDGRTALALTSHGRAVPLGSFLANDERLGFAATLKSALAAANAPQQRDRP